MLTARNGIERLRVEVRRLLDTTTLDTRVAIQQVLDTQPGHPPDRRNGQFAVVRFYDPRGASHRSIPMPQP